MQKESPGIFEGQLVLELASVLAGPSVGMFLAELGARVIKVENPRFGGDVTRSWRLPSEEKESDVSAYFTTVNWGKESIAVDLRSPEGKDIILELVDKADILISSFKPGSAERLGLDAPSLLKRNSRLICAEINGYGREAEKPAYDAIIQAETGFTFMNGQKELGIFKMPVALMDILAAHQLKEALLLAFIKRLQKGKGSRVSVSLIESGIASLANQASNWLVGQHLPQPMGSDHPNIVPYGTLFTCAEGKQLVLAVGTDQHFRALCQVLNLDLQDRFASNPMRVAAREEVKEMLSGAIANWTRPALLAALAESQVPAGAVNDLSEVMNLPQAQNLMLFSGELRGLRSFVAQGAPGMIPSTLSPPPSLGEQTEKVLRELLDCTQDQFSQWEKQGVVKG